MARVREIRASERRFYQKITDIYATAIDYDSTAEATKRFYATVQKKCTTQCMATLQQNSLYAEQTPLGNTWD